MSLAAEEIPSQLVCQRHLYYIARGCGQHDVVGEGVRVCGMDTLPPSLGLCRTCEIFGVRELVVASVAAVEDAQFTALSVSAQHWLKISEVSACCFQ